jgi:hypothetical protein
LLFLIQISFLSKLLLITCISTRIDHEATCVSLILVVLTFPCESGGSIRGTNLLVCISRDKLVYPVFVEDNKSEWSKGMGNGVRWINMIWRGRIVRQSWNHIFGHCFSSVRQCVEVCRAFQDMMSPDSESAWVANWIQQVGTKTLSLTIHWTLRNIFVQISLVTSFACSLWISEVNLKPSGAPLRLEDSVWSSYA